MVPMFSAFDPYMDEGGDWAMSDMSLRSPSFVAVLKDAALRKYNKPYGTQTLDSPQPLT